MTKANTTTTTTTTTRTIATSTAQAWAIVSTMINDYTKDETSSDHAGYPIYCSASNPDNYICDLNVRLEVNINGKSQNIWIEAPAQVTVTPTTPDIDTLARKATAGTLKRIYSGGQAHINPKTGEVSNTGSANDNIRKLRNALQADFSAMDNGIQDYIVSDAYDLYMTAYSYLHEQITVNVLTDQTEITVTLKNGKEKTRTVYQWACVLVRKEIYNNKAIENNGKFTYLEDLKQSETDTAETALDREYVRMGKYDGIQTDVDYDQYTDMLAQLPLKTPQLRIVKMRMQGLSLDAIAEKLGVSRPAISKQLIKVQGLLAAQFPDMVRGFKGQSK